MASFFDFSDRSYAATKNMHAISEPVKRHLRQVYWTVGTAILASAMGVYLHMLLNIGGFFTCLGFLGSTIWLASMPSSQALENKRWNILMVAAALQGASMGTLVESVLAFDPSIVVSAFAATAVVFGCFSAAALLAKRREYMFLGGFLASAVTTMLTLQFLSIFFGGASFVYMMELYGGLVVFSGYVIFDTQLIVERAEKGDMDYVKHSLELFVDFAALFVRILIILTKRAEEKERRKQKRKN